MFTEPSRDFTAPDRVYIYPDFTKHLDLVRHWRGCKLTVGATVQSPLISPCLVPEARIELLDRTVKGEEEQSCRASPSGLKIPWQAAAWWLTRRLQRRTASSETTQNTPEK